MDFKELLARGVVCLDGATGTMIQSLGLGDEYFGGPDYKMLVDLLSYSQPEAMAEIHLAFYRAGANAVETNTFGASPFRLAEYDFSGLDLSRFAANPYQVDLRRLSHDELAYWMSRRGAEIACTARDRHRADAAYDGRPLFVVGSLGPSNRVLSSTRADLRPATFGQIVDNFRRQALGLLDGGADVLLYETQQDILELKAAVMGGHAAMRERGRKVPVMAQVTVDQFSRMQIFNTHIHAAQVTMQGVGIDVFGINCSIGPDLMAKTVETLSRFSPLPVSVVPNAGLPVSENGKTVFRFDPDRFAGHLRDFVAEYGVRVVGGCCGTTPDHIRCTVETLRGVAPKARTPERGLYVSGPQEAVLLDGSKSLIRFGERLNIRGSKKVRDAVENDTGINHDVLEEVVREQIAGLGCEVIDVCMDSNTVDTVAVLKEVVHMQTTDFAGAMCLDSFQVDALEEAVKVYPGRPVVNSISLEEASPGVPKVDAVIGATNAHNPLYVALCTGPKGPAATAAEKLDLATQILERARDRFGVTPDRIFVDVNVFPIGSESVEGMNFAVESLEGIRLVKERFPETHTTLGVGNLTNGLAKKPYMRTVLTSVFLDEARKRGLDAAIINPNHYVFVSDLDPAHYALGLRVVLDRDMDAFAELEVIAEEKRGVVVARRTSYDDLPLEEAVVQKIKDGHKERVPGEVAFRGHQYAYQDRIVEQVAAAMETHAPLDFINTHLMRAMQDLGDGFGRGEVSLPHLLKSADVMRQAMGFLEALMRNESGVELHGEIAYKGTVVVGTVYQDVHSIGKDLARTLLENYGYRVIDLGTMTPLQNFIDAAREHNADAIGMSALLVQTSNHMITVARMMRGQGLDLPILIGGAPVSDRHAAFVAMEGGEDTAAMRPDVFYCRTAMDGVNVMNTLMTAAPEERAAFLEKNRAKLVKRFEHARQRAEKEGELLATLPRRVVAHGHVRLPETPRFRARSVEYDLRDFAPKVDRKTLYSLNWKFGGSATRAKSGHTAAELDALFDEWVDRAAKHGWLRPQGLFGLFPCFSDGDGVVLLDPEDPGKETARLDFTKVLGAGNEDVLSGAQFFPPRDGGAPGVIGLQITTGGPRVDTFIEQMKADGDSESALLLQGLSDRLAEDMADHLHELQRELLGIPGGQGIRWSPGYPGMREMQMNRVILETLGAGPAIGVVVTPAGEFSPTGTTAAVVSFHPEARYS
ncbi:MAG: dihydropteroate synthase [Candidatus Hydrogenedens sp.]|nr:homocysteine S-methyltransferase family protein [Candidatus Hydrogenedentota bacterium]NLF57441.1 dihydropteroate synthase [Candidatus Hydrogenedens sp.]